jgi:hypothetical protein
MTSQSKMLLSSRDCENLAIRIDSLTGKRDRMVRDEVGKDLSQQMGHNQWIRVGGKTVATGP